MEHLIKVHCSAIYPDKTEVNMCGWIFVVSLENGLLF